MTDQLIIEALIARNEQVTANFFFGSCRPLFLSIIRHVFSYEVNYDELVNELYLHLMENDAYRLKQFQGRSTIYQWIKIVAIRYFIAKRNSMIDMKSKGALLDIVAQKETIDAEHGNVARMDTEYLLSIMSNSRYAFVIKRLVLQDVEAKVVAQELGTTIDNLYNIKKRAIAALTEIALKEIEKYEKAISK